MSLLDVLFGACCTLCGAVAGWQAQRGILGSRYRWARLVEGTTGTRLVIDLKKMELRFDLTNQEIPDGLNAPYRCTRIRRKQPFTWEYECRHNHWVALDSPNLYGLEQSYAKYNLLRKKELV
jgi:hypothetical protein